MLAPAQSETSGDLTAGALGGYSAFMDEPGIIVL